MNDHPITTEYSESVTICVTPKPCPRIDFSGECYRVNVDTHPKYATDDLDFPISLAESDKKDSPRFQFELDDAEAVAKALLRAVEIRRELVAKHKETK